MMLLITVTAWYGPSRNCPPDKRPDTSIRQEGYATRLKLAEAIERLHKYERGFNQWATLSAITISVLCVSEIDDISDDHIEMANMQNIEALPQTAEDFG